MEDQKTNAKVDEFIEKSKKWKAEYKKLRAIALGSGLTEDYKWMHPCYTYQGKNVILIHGFKEYCALLFHKGALLQDADGLLVQQTQNVQAGRQIRFTHLQEIVDREPAVKAYISEAIDIEKAGLTVNFKTHEDFTVPEELQSQFDRVPALKIAFEALTPGRQRAYILHFSQPKQSKTRAARVEKYTQPILDGKGLND